MRGTAAAASSLDYGEQLGFCGLKSRSLTPALRTGQIVRSVRSYRKVNPGGPHQSQRQDASRRQRSSSHGSVERERFECSASLLESQCVVARLPINQGGVEVRPIGLRLEPG